MATVLVGCKLPHGLVAELNGRKVTLAGANSSRLIGGFGITEVDKEFADAWLAVEKDTPIVSNGLVFITGTERDAKSAATERQGQATGLEPLSSENPAAGVKKAEE